MLLRNTVKLPPMSLSLIPQVLDPIDVIMLMSKEFRMVDSVVLKLGHIQGIIATPTVTIYDTIYLELLVVE